MLIFLTIILVKIISLGRDQNEIARTVNLLMDMVEFQSESINRKIENDPPVESPNGPSIVAYQKPTLVEEPKANPPPPPPPAKLKRW